MLEFFWDFAFIEIFCIFVCRKVFITYCKDTPLNFQYDHIFFLLLIF
jgi:hypothetical protein